MLLLFRTPAGFALLQVSDVEELSKELPSSAETLRQIVKPKAFLKFVNTAEALRPAARLVKSKRHEGLRVFLRAHCQGETLGVADKDLSAAVQEHMHIDCVHNSAVEEAIKAVQSQLTELISGIAGQVDTTIIQAIGSLDDREKELTSHAKRVREWYGWHFPELDQIVKDNIAYAKTVRLMGSRSNAAELDFSEILPREVEAELKKAAMISTGIEASDIDFIAIRELCDQVLSLSEYRAQLYDYLKRRMNATAPNVTALVGELVGARLIAHAGSMMNLAKEPGSSIQMMGNQLLNHASLVSHATTPKMKFKIARPLAAKTALAVRYDACRKNGDNCFGLEALAMLEAKLSGFMDIEHRKTELIGKQIGVYVNDSKKRRRGARKSAAKSLRRTADSAYGQALSDAANEIEPLVEKSSEAPEEDKETRKEKKKRRKSEEEEKRSRVEKKDKKKKKNSEEVEGEELGKKEKKKKKNENGVEGGEKAGAGEENKKKKKRKHADEDEEEAELSSKKKEKKRKHAEEDKEETKLPSKKKEKKKSARIEI